MLHMRAEPSKSYASDDGTGPVSLAAMPIWDSHVTVRS
jgi:hypothetical protein